MALSEAAQAEVAECLIAHPANVVERRITNLILHEDYLHDPVTVAMYMFSPRKMGWLAETLWRRRIVDRNPEPGPVVVSVRHVRELRLTDDELEAIMLHEMGHAIIIERDGMDRPVLPEEDESEKPDREALVDEWMRDSGFEAEASILDDIVWGGR